MRSFVTKTSGKKGGKRMTKKAKEALAKEVSEKEDQDKMEGMKMEESSTVDDQVQAITIEYPSEKNDVIETTVVDVETTPSSSMPSSSSGGSGGGSSKGEAIIGGFSKMIHPALQLHGLHAKYANAIFSVASKNESLEKVEMELISIEDLVLDQPNFAEFLKNPTIAKHKKKKSIAGIMKEGNFTTSVSGLFAVLAENGRLPETKGVIKCFRELMASHRGEIQAKVVSADPLTEAQLVQVKSVLAKHIEVGQTLVLETDVDVDILGGLKVHVGSKFIDLSLASKINKLHTLLSTPVSSRQ